MTPAKRGTGNKPNAGAEGEEETLSKRRASMSWAQRLKRVFNIDADTCRACGGAVRIIACIEDPVVIDKIRTHLDKHSTPVETSRLPLCRGPPQAGLFA